MKAIICTKYGTPDVLELKDVAKPIPKNNEILIKVHAAVVGPADCAFRKGDPFIVRIIYGLSKPRLSILGTEFSGVVESMGKNVTQFKKGDQVFGLNPDTFGAHAEYMTTKAEKAVALKGKQMSHEQAVGLADGATTALTFLRNVAKLKRDQKVLINGASGAVGSYAVQLAKYFGAEVTGVCSSTNVELVKSLGANFVIDYTKVDFTNNGKSYDVIFDAVGKSSFSECKASLTTNGIYMSTFPSLGIVFQILKTSILGGKKAKFTTAGLKQSKENLEFLKGLFEAGKLQAVIDRHYTLEQVAEAHKYVDTGHKKGNVIINVSK